jgi:anaerobic ribonucleoside-triphosphate reductase activating protein
MKPPKSRNLQYQDHAIQNGDQINLAAVCPGTRALGPGRRAVVWVQGCPFRCAGCISPEWLEFKPANLMSPEELADILLSDSNINGLTFSGGEPMQQAAGLARLAKAARAIRDVDIISFSGYKLEVLKKGIPDRSVFDLLDQLDVLIDGQYIQMLNDNLGMRGSTNQRIHYLTPRLENVDFNNLPRSSEVQILDGQIMLVGVPEESLLLAFYRAIWQLEDFQPRLVTK